MSIGNFFIWAELDGQSDILEGGPRGEDGGFNLVIHQRNNGGVVTPVKICGRSDNGELLLEVSVDGQPVHAVTTPR